MHSEGQRFCTDRDVVAVSSSMGFRDPFHYRTCSEIDKGYPDLHTPKWNLKKIKKVKTTNLKLISNINVDPTKKRDFRIDTIWLAQLYFQRYFTQNSFQTNSPLVFMAACVHLACKANDTPRSLEFVIKHIYRLRYAREEAEAKKINDIMVYVEFKVCFQGILRTCCTQHNQRIPACIVHSYTSSHVVLQPSTVRW